MHGMHDDDQQRLTDLFRRAFTVGFIKYEIIQIYFIFDPISTSRIKQTHQGHYNLIRPIFQSD